ncbi:hypothetical protein SAMN04488121_102599 [Chitinophaga filiformis]|uniref:Uncharacterized protein n=1 Tax=Chitinophaga filiformis TaxID=104663 RepID=A0A1G7MYI8_CHIFI|nr:hypothetical protein SAMN04488121_102599 [Chitinophaga filiformis]
MTIVVPEMNIVICEDDRRHVQITYAIGQEYCPLTGGGRACADMTRGFTLLILYINRAWIQRQHFLRPHHPFACFRIYFIK